MTISRLSGIVLLILVLIAGCSGPNGNIRKQTDNADKVTLAELRDNWDDYDIYYSMRSNRWADAIMFDPKDNNTTLTGDSWYKIESQEALDEKIIEVRTLYDYRRVFLIVGADNQVYGYMFYPYHLRVQVEIVDDQTLYVGSLRGYGSAP